MILAAKIFYKEHSHMQVALLYNMCGIPKLKFSKNIVMLPSTQGKA